MDRSQREAPDDPEADIIDDDEENTGNYAPADEGYSDGLYVPTDNKNDQNQQYIMGRNSRPSGLLQMGT